jgi:hypothetical protein
LGFFYIFEERFCKQKEMAFSNSAISIETRFQLNNSPKNFKITDDTDYVGTYGIALADVIGALKITDPSNTVIHNTVLPSDDIDLDVQTYIDSINLPTDANGDVLTGNYVIEYTVRVAGAVDPGDYTKTFTYCNDYEAPSANITVDVDLVCSKFTSTDVTDYPAELTNSTLTHTIYPPAGLPDATYPDQVVSTVSNTYTPITTKTWTAGISNVIEVTYSDGLIIEDTITGNVEKEIVDDVNLCNAQCQLRSLVSRYEDALRNNTDKAKVIYIDELSPALVFYSMFVGAINCGEFSKAEGYYTSMLEYTGSNTDCSCSDSSEPTLITPNCGASGGGQTFVVDVCGTNAALTVSSNTVGDTTTYTICFDNALFTKLNTITETDIVSTDSSVTISDSTSGYTKTYDLSVPATSVVHSFNGIAEIDLSNKTAVPTNTFRANWSTVMGDKFQEPSIINEDTTFATWAAANAVFYLDGYVDQSGGEKPKPHLQVNSYSPYDSDPSSNLWDLTRNFEVEVVDIDTANDRIYFRFVDRTQGLALTGTQLINNYNSIAVTVTLNA